jgi:NAD(P)H-hydrate epimerase
MRHLAQNTTGNPGLARGGSGDVLAGIIAALCARGLPAFNAAQAGVYLHGLAADIAAAKFTQEAMLPSDVIEALPDAFAALAVQETT